MDVHEAITVRRSVRKFSNRPILAKSLEKLKAALRFAPSACNYQPWRFLLVTDEAQRSDLAKASNDQKWMASAPLIVVGCGFADQAYKKMGNRDGEAGNSIEIDIAIALDHLTLAAAAEELGTCWIGAFDEPSVKDLLDIPDDVSVPAMIAVGHPAKPDMIRPVNESLRKSEAELFNTDRFSNS